MKIAFRLGLVLLLTCHASAKPPADLQQRLDDWGKGLPGGVAVAWVDADGTAFFQTGHFDGADSPAITADTQFEIGSITKVFTALLLAESERAGKVNRQDPAAKYLLPAGDPAQAALAKISLLSLTTHTSGLASLPSNLGAATLENPYAAYGREALIEGLRVDGPRASDNAAANYSNFGVSVLGQALAAAWGSTYPEALRDQVLAPLGLKVTSLGLSGLPTPADLAQPHLGMKPVGPWTFEACAPAGALRSSARDLALFLEACLGRRPVLQEALRLSFEPQREFPDLGSRIALGWLVSGPPDRTMVWHNGLTRGSHSFLGFDPKAGAGVVILANQDKGPEVLGFALLGSEMPRPASNAVGNAGDYPGRYPLSAAFAIDITEAGGAIFCQATGQPRFALRPSGKDRFTIVGVPAEISFTRGADGRVTNLVLHQNGIDQRAPRKELPAVRTEPPPARKEIGLPAETLGEYQGSYPIVPSFVLTVSVEGGGLWVQATGQPKFPVFATARDEFFYQVVDAQISFQRDEAGKVTGLVLHQNGRDMPAKKAK